LLETLSRGGGTTAKKAGAFVTHDEKDYAALLGDRAEECRAIAEILRDADLKAQYLKLAKEYLRLAVREEQLRGKKGSG
jgi:hypothetical protein